MSASHLYSNALGANSGTLTAGASAQLVPAANYREGLSVEIDPGATNAVYFLLGAGTASATNFHFSLNPGSSWDGRIGDTFWTGAIQFFSAGASKVGVVEI